MLSKLMEKFGIGIALLVVIVFMAVQSPVFLSSANLFNILLQVSINTIVAVE